MKGGTSRFFGIFRPWLKTTEKSSLYNKWLINLVVVTCMVKVVKCLKNTSGIWLLREDSKKTIDHMHKVHSL